MEGEGSSGNTNASATADDEIAVNIVCSPYTTPPATCGLRSSSCYTFHCPLAYPLPPVKYNADADDEEGVADEPWTTKEGHFVKDRFGDSAPAHTVLYGIKQSDLWTSNQGIDMRPVLRVQ
jgi:hypothetical protein